MIRAPISNYHVTILSPLDKYQELIDQRECFEDPAQAQVVHRLNDLYDRLSAVRKRKGISGWLRAWRLRGHGPIKGLYIWGGVGRGKTMLMDLFYECLPPDRRLRMHFHRFMRRVHEGLRTWSGTPNPLMRVASEFTEEADVLCFDEFFVSDIGDAMILAELLEALFAGGMTLVATSNVEPKMLYENGLQRRRFLPAIDLLNQHTHVLHISEGADYRLRALEQAEIYHWPLDAAAEVGLTKSFNALAPGTVQTGETLNVEGRPIPTVLLADDVAWFEFSQLCEGPRSQNDYIELAMVYHAVILSNVPVMTTATEDAARRFISLVDEFYDHGVKLIISAAAAVTDIYQGERLHFEFARTMSRLIEMQSHEYLAKRHEAAQ